MFRPNGKQQKSVMWSTMEKREFAHEGLISGIEDYLALHFMYYIPTLGYLVQFVKVLFETMSGLQEEEKAFCERSAHHHGVIERIQVSSGK